MRVLSGLLGLVLFGGSAGALEPVSENHVTINFDVPGGYFEKWTREGIAPASESEPYEMRFAVTGINSHSKWTSSISFFFKQGAATEAAKTGSAMPRDQEFRLRFRWSEEERVISPVLSIMPGEERNIAKIYHPIALNQPVTFAIRRRNADTLMLLIDGKDAFVDFSDRLGHLTVLVSGIKGAISMPRE